MGLGDRQKAFAQNQIDKGQQVVGGGQSITDDTQINMPDGSVKTLGQLKNEGMMQADYTKKTQELADKTREVDEMKARISTDMQELDQRRRFGENIHAYFADRPDVFEDVKSFFDSGQSSLPKQDEGDDDDKGKIQVKDKKKEVDPLLQESQQKLAQMEKQFQNVNNELANIKVKDAVKQFRTDNPNVTKEDMEAILKHANENYNANKDYLGNISDSYKVLQFDQLQEQQRLTKEKQEAVLFSGKDEQGKPMEKTPTEEFTELFNNTPNPESIF